MSIYTIIGICAVVAVIIAGVVLIKIVPVEDEKDSNSL